uniref:Uncharacterized protein n=1 Tax=Ditylenchus dipsaci TaxID=166011 RepID=A0A915CPD3_9BILA
MTSDQAHESHCRREYAGAKISKVKFLLDEYDNAEYFVTGSWGKAKHAASDSVTLWSTKNEPTEESSGIEKLSCQKVESDVNDISVVSQSRFVVGLSNGDIKVFGCSGEALESKQTYSTVHAKASSTAVCVVSNTIFSGTPKLRFVTTDLMEVTSLVSYGTSQLVSAHTTGQQNSSSFQSCCCMNDSVTAIASHPSEPNVIAFGTNSGHISFFDIRAPSKTFRIY